MIASLIASVTTIGFTTGVVGGIGFQLFSVTRLAVFLVRERLCNECV